MLWTLACGWRSRFFFFCEPHRRGPGCRQGQVGRQAARRLATMSWGLGSRICRASSKTWASPRSSRRGVFFIWFEYGFDYILSCVTPPPSVPQQVRSTAGLTFGFLLGSKDCHVFVAMAVTNHCCLGVVSAVPSLYISFALFYCYT